MATRKYHRLTFEERLEVEKLYKKGLSDAKVAEMIGVSRMTMNRERKRGTDPKTNMYDADLAQRSIFS